MCIHISMRFKFALFCLIKNSVLCGLIAFLCVYLFPLLYKIFTYNVAINSLIVFSIVAAIVLIFSKTFQFEHEYIALQRFSQLNNAALRKFVFLKPITLYITRDNNLISHSQIQTVIDDVEKKIASSLILPKYIASTLIFLGLLGTFWGLSHTIGNVAGIIDTLGVDESDVMVSFNNLKESLRIPLLGMGTAFGCSLFALVGSIFISVMVLNLKKLGDVFVDNVEEWIASYTINFNIPEENIEYHGELFSMGLLEKTIETIYAFQNQLNNLESTRVSIVQMQAELSQNLSKITDKMLDINFQKIESVIDTISERLSSIGILLETAIKQNSSDKKSEIQVITNEIRFVSKILSNMAK